MGDQHATHGGQEMFAPSTGLAGVRIADGRDYERVLSTARGTLGHRLTEHRHRAVALIPRLRSPWPVQAFDGGGTEPSATPSGRVEARIHVP